MDDAISTFTALARSYCSFIEDSAAPNSWVFAQTCLTQLLCLYQAALLLPETGPENADLLERIKHETWSTVRQNVERKLARDHYWEVFEPLEQDKPEPVVGSLSDDLADIWRDLSPGVAAIDSLKPSSVCDVVWSWRNSFEIHWGHHAASAIAALHALCFGQFADEGRPPFTP